MKITGSLRCLLNGNSNLSVAPDEGIVTFLNTDDILSRYDQYSENYEVGISLVLESVESSTNITSIGLAKVPLINPEDEPAEKQLKIQQMESRFPKIGLQMLCDNSDGRGWVPHATMTLQNQGGEYYDNYLSPFLSVKNYLAPGRGYKLGFRNIDLGNGLLRGQDYCLITGTYTLAVSLTQPARVRPGNSGIWQQTVQSGKTIVEADTCRFGYAQRVQVNRACRIRYYAARQDAVNDLNRTDFPDYTIKGLCFETVLGSDINEQGGSETILSLVFKPNTVVCNRELPQAAKGYLAVECSEATTIQLQYTAIA